MNSPKLILAAITTLVLVSGPATPEIIERIVAKVNGGIVTLSEFTRLQLGVVQQAGISPDQVPAFLRKNNSQILDEAIDDLLLIQHADELGFQIRPEYIDSIVEDIRKENNITTDDQLRAQLRTEGMTLRGLRQNIERSIIKRQLISMELEPKIAVEDTEVVAEYETNQSTKYFRRATAQLQEIVVDSPELALELAARARAGEDFAALARSHSTSATAAAGGDLGRLTQGELTPELEELVFSLDEGSISEPLPIEAGSRLLRVVARTEEGVIPFDEVKEQISGRLSEERRVAEYGKYIANLREDAVIHIMVREVPVELGGSAPAASESPGTPEQGGSRPRIAIPDFSDEISVSPQAQPTKVTPPALPGEQPTPTPTPPPEE